MACGVDDAAAVSLSSRKTLTNAGLFFADAMSPPQRAEQTQECQHHKAGRLRGGGAAKDCFLGAFECFICFEGCKDCCECCADIICAYTRLPLLRFVDSHVVIRLPVRDVLLNAPHISHTQTHIHHLRVDETSMHTLYHRLPFFSVFSAVRTP